MLRPLALAALCLTAFAGCDAFDDSDYTYETTAAAYAPGDVVTLRLENTSNRDIGYNLCFSTLEVREDAAWNPSPFDDRVCTAHIDGIPPGGTDEARIGLQSRLPGGTYRFVTRLGVGDREHTARTPPFEVR